MPDLFEKIHQANVVVYATPLYSYTFSGLMKDFMDRTLPLSDPHTIKQGDNYTHPSRYAGEKKAVLISTCGFPDRNRFSGLVETFRHCCSCRPDKQLAATILCVAGELLKLPEAKEGVEWYIDAVRRAGQEFVEDGRITPETQELLDRNLVDPEFYYRMGNAHWDSVSVKE